MPSSEPVDLDTFYHPTRHHLSIHLYPHKISDYIVLVPIEINDLNANILKFIVLSPFFYWFHMVFVMALIRRAFNRRHHHDLVTLIVDTYGIMLATTGGLAAKCRSERIVLVAMSVSALFLSIVFSSILYRNSYSPTKNLTFIDTLLELGRSNLSITMMEVHAHIIRNNSNMCQLLCTKYCDRYIYLDKEFR